MKNEKSTDLRTIIEKLATTEGYMLSVSLLDKNGKIDHHIINDNFPFIDMLPSHGEIKNLIISNLENLGQTTSEESNKK